MVFIYSLLILLAILLLLGFIIGYIEMRYIIYPRRVSHEDAEDIERGKGFLEGYDSYEKEEWNIPSFDGYLLHGELIKADSDKYVIVTHGYTYNMRGSIKYAKAFHNLGYNVYIYDLRHFGKNQECFCSMGYYESKDIIAVQEAMFRRFGEEITIGLHGESLGCASSLIALSLSQRFAFLVADCGFSDLNMLLKDLAVRNLHLPSIIVWFTDLWMKLCHQYKFTDIMPINSMETNNVPILFFHGEKDDFILPEHTKRMFELCNAKKKLHIIEGAAHAQSYETDPIGYEEKIKEFLH